MASLASYIEHTLLKHDALEEEIKKLVEEAESYHFKAICVFAKHLKWVKKYLKDPSIIKVTVIDFPKGNHSIIEKVEEAKEALLLGADELDLVIDIDGIKKKDFAKVFLDIEEVRKISKGHILKVIIETCLLSFEEKIIASALVKAASADYVKTSTGFSFKGATLEDVELIHRIVGKFGIKASGQIRTLEQALGMIQAGATRIGTSSSVAIIKESQKNLEEKWIKLSKDG